MRGCEIRLNGKLLCVSAFRGPEYLVAAVDHIFEHELESRLRVFGSPHEVLEHQYIAEAQLKTGDEVLVTIVETDQPTEPLRREDVSIPGQS